MSSPKTARWLDLIAFLLSHRYPVTREDIYINVNGYLDEPPPPDGGRGQGVRGEGGRGDEVVRRKFERDKDELRALGIEIETVPIPDAAGDEPATGYRLRPGAFYLPYLELHQANRVMERPYQGVASIAVSRADLEILDRATQLVAQRTESPLGAAAASARRKIEFDLPLPQGAVERVLAAPLDNEGIRALEVLQTAVADRVAVSCHYHSIGRNQEDKRSIEPYGLFFSWGRWYCVARARDREALRVFRVDRMAEAATEKGKQASFEVPDGFSIRAYVGRAPWELSEAEPTTVRVRFAFPESRWVMAQGVGQVVDALLDDGGAVLDFAVRDQNPFLRWLLTFRKQAEVQSPPEIRNELGRLRRQVSKLYAATSR
ncbi:MAG: WYL domain-containing protein [Gemmatimonadota bacterium]